MRGGGNTYASGRKSVYPYHIANDFHYWSNETGNTAWAPAYRSGAATTRAYEYGKFVGLNGEACAYTANNDWRRFGGMLVRGVKRK